MATLWWIGATANGDVNIAANWTPFGPGAYQAGYTALVPASNIPKYNDVIAFDKFIPGGVVYPLYSPIGDMRGICGPLGNTAAQWFQEVRVNPGCPKPIGGATAFGFRTSSLVIKRGITGTLPNDYTTSHYFHLYDCGGVTKINANIIIDSTIKENYFLSGVAGQLRIGAQFAPESGRMPYSNIFLNNMELQGRTFSSGSPTQLAEFNAAIEARESNTTYDNNLTNTPQVYIYVYPTTTIANNIYLRGKEKLIAFRGFNLPSTSIFMSDYNNTRSMAQLEFRSDENSSLTGTGPDIATRSYVYELNMVGDPSVTDGLKATLPRLTLDHGVDINILNFRGTGQVTTQNEQSADTPRILRGTFDFATAGSPDDPFQQTKMGFYSDTDIISFGPSGTFIWNNTHIGGSDTYGILRSNLRGTWAYKITPLFDE
jgi:hypothetical protein